MAVRVGINGFGRIGRAFARASYGNPDIEVVAINDLAEAENLAYLLKYDTVYGRAPFDVSFGPASLSVGGNKVRFTQSKNPAEIGWDHVGVDVVVESTGVFTDYEKAALHIQGGAPRVVISAPAKGEEGSTCATILMGVNEGSLKTCPVTSNASCTTNAASPLIAILDEALGIEKALLNTVHAYTASQMIVDGPGGVKDMRRGRAAAQNIVPSHTGAAQATTKVHTQLENKFDGIALRVPVPSGSIADITFIAARDTSTEEVNDILRKAAQEPHWKGIFDATDEPLVSSDIIGNAHAAVVELSMTRVIGNLVKVLAWYDNEMGYTHTLVRHVITAGNTR